MEEEHNCKECESRDICPIRHLVEREEEIRDIGIPELSDIFDSLFSSKSVRVNTKEMSDVVRKGLIMGAKTFIEDLKAQVKEHEEILRDLESKAPPTIYDDLEFRG